MSYILLLASRMDSASFAVHFEGGKCIIHSSASAWKVVARIPVAHDLYRTTDQHEKSELANIAET